MSEEDKSLADFSSKALRGPKKGALNQALSWYFFKALEAKPLEKIIKTGEILGMLSEGQLNELEVDLKQFKTFSLLAHTISNPSIFTRDMNGRAYAVNWPFPENQETWDRYFKPWNPEILNLMYYPNMVFKNVEEYREKGQNEIYFLIISTQGMSEATYYAIKNRFIEYALPETMRVLSKIATLIEPKEFLEVANMSQEKDEVKETEAP
jgi:hypothetical protein